MRFACLQYAPRLGEVEANLRRVNELVKDIRPDTLDWLVLPELAFTGYNFASMSDISPHLEDTANGISAAWARDAARKLRCIVTVGYPEISDEVANDEEDHDDAEKPSRPLNRLVAVVESRNSHNGKKCYNATLTVDWMGNVIMHYRKAFLYYTDATWAHAGTSFGAGVVQSRSSEESPVTNKPSMEIIRFAHGICMDINPRAFIAPWSAYEFATHARDTRADVIVLTMAWLGDVEDQEMASERIGLSRTIEYWITRLEPIVLAPRWTTVVVANRCGVETTATYAGNSCVMKVGHARVDLLDTLGESDENLLIVDTQSGAVKTMLRLTS